MSASSLMISRNMVKFCVPIWSNRELQKLLEDGCEMLMLCKSRTCFGKQLFVSGYSSGESWIFDQVGKVFNSATKVPKIH